MNRVKNFPFIQNIELFVRDSISNKLLVTLAPVLNIYRLSIMTKYFEKLTIMKKNIIKVVFSKHSSFAFDTSVVKAHQIELK